MTIRIFADEITPVLAAMAAPAAKAAALLAGGTQFAAIGQRAFDEPHLRPSPWAPRVDDEEHPLLKKSGFMWQVFQVGQPDGETIDVGNSASYAMYHQAGQGRKYRPFFPVDGDGTITEEGQELIGAAMKAALIAAGKRSGSAAQL